MRTPLGQPKCRRIEKVATFEYEKKQLLEINSIHLAFIQTVANSMLDFKGARGARPCPCAAYLAMIQLPRTVVWDYSDI